MAGFHAAAGVLTSEGGKASHAALVARGMGVPAVTGAADLEIDVNAREVRIDGRMVLREGDVVTIDGTTGAVTTDDVPLVEPEMNDHFRTVLTWADELRRLDVRANADTPGDARKARDLGAEGIGLCRTEHMFFGDERREKMVRVILASETKERRAALEELLPLQQGDFEAIFEVMDGLPVTIRLLDPPLHEFLPKLADIERQVERARVERGADLDRLTRTCERVRALQEVNPMLGTRGVRLGLLHPEIYEMQVCSIFRALLAARRRGVGVHAEILVPLVSYRRELELLLGLIRRAAETHGLQRGEDYTVGTMIELPRACLRADDIAHEADFFSFGTNDLTQTALGFSRDDIESRDPVAIHRRSSLRAFPVRNARRAGRRSARAHGRMARAQDQAQPEAGRLRRARRRPDLDRLLPRLRDRLRVLLAVPRPGRPGRRCPSGGARYRQRAWRQACPLERLEAGLDDAATSAAACRSSVASRSVLVLDAGARSGRI